MDEQDNAPDIPEFDEDIPLQFEIPIERPPLNEPVPVPDPQPAPAGQLHNGQLQDLDRLPGRHVPDNGPTYRPVQPSVMYENYDFDLADFEDAVLMDSSTSAAVVCVRSHSPETFMGMVIEPASKNPVSDQPGGSNNSGSVVSPISGIVAGPAIIVHVGEPQPAPAVEPRDTGTGQREIGSDDEDETDPEENDPPPPDPMEEAFRILAEQEDDSDMEENPP